MRSPSQVIKTLSLSIIQREEQTENNKKMMMILLTREEDKAVKMNIMLKGSTEVLKIKAEMRMIMDIRMRSSSPSYRKSYYFALRVWDRSRR